MCSSKPPKPDPLIGQTAKQNADIAQQQLDVAKQQLEWERDRASVQDRSLKRLLISRLHRAMPMPPGRSRNGRFTAICSRP
jgi:hypothetical protein